MAEVVGFEECEFVFCELVAWFALEFSIGRSVRVWEESDGKRMAYWIFASVVAILECLDCKFDRIFSSVEGQLIVCSN